MGLIEGSAGGSQDLFSQVSQRHDSRNKSLNSVFPKVPNIRRAYGQTWENLQVKFFLHFSAKMIVFFHFFPFFRSCLALDLVGKDDPTKHFFRHLFWGKGFLIDPCPLGTPSHCRNFVGCFLFTLAHLTSQLCRFIWKPQFCFSSLIVGIIVYTFHVPNHQSWQMLCLCFRVPAFVASIAVASWPLKVLKVCGVYC